MQSRTRRSAAAGLGVAAVVASFAAAGIDGYPAVHPQLLSGAAWLPSAGIGALTLLDGSSAEVAAQVQVAGPGDHLSVVQHGERVYAVDRSSGAVRRVDPTSFEAGPAVTPLPGAGLGLTVLAGDNEVYGIDADHGVLATVDSLTLQPMGGTLTFSTPLASSDVELDSAGRLWVLDRDSGTLVRVDGGHRQVVHAAARPGAGTLVLADGNPVLVDATAGTAAVLDPADGGVAHRMSLDLRVDDHPRVVGAAHEGRLYVVEARGAVALCDLHAEDCPRAVPIGGVGSAFGPPVETAGRVFVPDYATGSVWIVDAARGTVVASPNVLDPNVRFQLLVKDGIVFFNDPDSARAGIIRLDGGVRHVAKYDQHASVTTSPTPSSSTPAPVPTPGSPPAPTNTPAPKPTPAVTTPTPTPGPARTTPQTTGPTSAPAPDVQITASSKAATVGATITFEAAATGGTLASAGWQFGDGRRSNGTTVDHEWTTAGTYQVAVQATFTDGRTATASITVTIAPVGQQTLTLQVRGPGTVVVNGTMCPPTCSITADRGTVLQLAGQPSAGAHLSGWSGDCSGNATTCMVALESDHAVSVTFAGTLAAPKLYYPADGLQLHANPRSGGLTWAAVPGAVSYHVQVDYDGGAWLDTTSNTTSFAFTFPGDKQGRWRITATGPDGVAGTASPWWSFSWDITTINKFAGTWQDTNPANTVVPRMRITVLSSTTASVFVQTCQTAACLWIDEGQYTLDGQKLTKPPRGPDDWGYELTVSANRLTEVATRAGLPTVTRIYAMA